MTRCGLLGAFGLLLPTALVAQSVAEVQVAPPSVTIRVGERTGLLATAFDRIGNVIPTVRIIWSSNNVNIAKVDNNGTVTGVANGVAIIEARVGARRGQAAIQATAAGGLTATAPVVVQQAEFTVREGSPLMLSPGEVDTLHVVVATQNNRTVN